MIDAAILTVVAIMAFVLPGAVVGWSLGMRPLWACISGLAITAGLFSVLSSGYALVGIAVTPISLGLGTMGAAGCGLLWQFAYAHAAHRSGRQMKSHSPGTGLTGVIIPVLGVLAGLVVILSRTIGTYLSFPDGLSSRFQGWDVHWHASVIRYIAETGVASASEMGPLQNVETHDPLYYPTAFHTLAFFFYELSGRDLVFALNLSSLVIPALGLTISAACLSKLALASRELVSGLAAGIAPVLVVGVHVLFYSEYHMGAWPYLAGVSIAGIAACAIAQTVYNPASVPAAGLAFAGVVGLHPGPATVVIFIVGFWWISYMVGQRLGGRGVRALVRDTLIVATAGVFGAVLMLPQVRSGAGQAGEVSNFAETQLPVTRSESWYRAAQLQWSNGTDIPTQWWLVSAAVAGAVILAARHRRVWPQMVTLVFLATTVHSLKWFGGAAGELAGAYTSLHYNSAHRLVLPVALMYTVLAAVAVASVALGVASGSAWIAAKLSGNPLQRSERVKAWVSVVVVVAAAGTNLYWMQRPFSGHYKAVIILNVVNGPLRESERRAFDWLSTQPRAYDGIIANNPDEGTGWMYPLNGLPSLHRHYLYPGVDRSSATELLYTRPDLLGAGLPTPGYGPDGSDYANLVDFAARELNITYYIVSPPAFWPDQHPVPAQVHGLWTAPGVTPVYHDGDTVVFAVNENLSDEELRSVRASGEAASPDGLPPRDNDGSAAFHRPSLWDRAAAIRSGP